MINKIKNIVFKVLYILVIIYLLTFVPLIFGYKPLVVLSGSMEPTLKVGSILYYHNENVDYINDKDILVYKTKDHIISHRVVTKLNGGFITRGDANKSNDSNVIVNEQVLGKGTNWCIPLLGYYSDFIYNHKSLLYISISFLMLDLLNDFYNTHKKKVGVINEKNS